MELFPNELQAIYFSPPVSSKKSPTGKFQRPKGKLWNKYKYLKQTPKELFEGSNDVAESNFDDNTDNVEIDPEELATLQPGLDWLMNNEEPWTTAVYHWRQTSTYRRLKIGEDQSKTVSQILVEWPILKTPKALDLIKLDFRLGGFGSEENGMKDFSSFYDKLVQIRDFRSNLDFVQSLRGFLDDAELNES